MEHSIKLKSKQFARVGKSKPKHLSINKTNAFVRNLFSEVLFKTTEILNKSSEG
ncbi:hypothetical protein [Algibacter sp. 2305UL17-15]|uniref:hypothetical protein n=1 Tax=Algibacter sp. 2305UL17-15 TaxID=3231268 RepID=UPI00345A0E21